MEEKRHNQVTFDYDPNADVIYVSFGTGEPSYSEEVDDHIVLDLGMFTGAPTGFQLLHVREAGIEPISNQLVKKLIALLSKKRQELKSVISKREKLMKKAVECLPKRTRELVIA